MLLATVLMASAVAVHARDLKSATLHVEKLYCGACALSIKKALAEVAGVHEVAVDIRKREVTVRFDAARADMDTLSAAAEKRGFPATVLKSDPQP